MNSYDAAGAEHAVAPQDTRFTFNGYSSQIEVEDCCAVWACSSPQVVYAQAVALRVAVWAGKVECVYAAVAVGYWASYDKSA